VPATDSGLNDFHQLRRFQLYCHQILHFKFMNYGKAESDNISRKVLHEWVSLVT